MSTYAYYNGNFDTRENIKLPLSDRAVFFGDGIYDASIGRNENIFLESEHIDRFLCNAKALNISHKYTEKSLSNVLHEVIKKSGINSFFLYFQLTRNSNIRVHSPKLCTNANLLITIEPHTLPDENKKMRLITYEDKRYGYCNLKTLNLLPSVMASEKADDAGCEEAVFIRNGIVTECAHSNISILKSGRLKTHPLNEHILPGITRRHLIFACNALGIECRECTFGIDELYSADEILITSTTKLCLPASHIDGVKVGGGDRILLNEICHFLRDEYNNFTR